MKKIILSAAMLGALSLSANTASAEPLALTNFNVATSPPTTVTSCLLCHNVVDANTNSALNSFGDNFKTAGGSKSLYVANYTTLGAMDADGNGTVNSVQINNGDAPAGNGTLTAFTVPATTPTTSDGGGGGCIASSTATPLMMVLAMLSLGFFVRRKKS